MSKPDHHEIETIAVGQEANGVHKLAAKRSLSRWLVGITLWSALGPFACGYSCVLNLCVHFISVTHSFWEKGVYNCCKTLFPFHVDRQATLLKVGVQPKVLIGPANFRCVL
jgi:hypothetical protein